MNSKMIEIRDYGTTIASLAIQTKYEDVFEHKFLGHLGYAENDTSILLIKLSTGECHYDPYKWNSTRTMRAAHQHIKEHFDELNSGDVVDVEYILGESNTIKSHEIYKK